MQTASESPRILEHEPGDLTCIVEAGLRLSALRDELAAHGQRLSLDPPGDPTLAECLLDDLSGPLSHRFGTMRDLVIGVTVVLPDGLRASSGGKVVKNVAGYDLAKLFCGSRGRLGSVERLALRLHPLPAAARDGRARRGLAGAAPLAARRRAPSTSRTAACTSSSRACRAPSTRRCSALGGEEAEPWAGAARAAGGPARPRALGRPGGAARASRPARRLRRAGA